MVRVKGESHLKVNDIHLLSDALQSSLGTESSDVGSDVAVSLASNLP